MIQRKVRVAAELMRITNEVVREEIHDPGMGFITFLKADVSRDLRSAVITYSVMGEAEDKKRTDIIIRNASKRLKWMINQKLKLRYAIDVNFKRATDIDETFKIQAILDRIAKENNKDEKDQAI